MNKLGKILIIMGVTLIISSIILLTYNNYEEINAGKKSAVALDNIKNNIEKTNKDKQEVPINETKTEKITNIDGYNYIGTITIPTLKLELPVMSEYNYELLKIAPCRYYGSIHTNDLIICGHSYKTHFKYLNKLKQNDIVIITDINGIHYIYEVLEIEILNPEDVDKMINNDFDLTLYTCTNDGLRRVTIRCNRINNKA